MSCKDETKQNTLLTHLKDHIKRPCQNCNIEMLLQDGALPFGNAMMTTWICPDCKTEDVTVFNENGDMLEINPDLS